MSKVSLLNFVGKRMFRKSSQSTMRVQMCRVVATCSCKRYNTSCDTAAENSIGVILLRNVTLLRCLYDITISVLADLVPHL